MNKKPPKSQKLTQYSVRLKIDPPVSYGRGGGGGSGGAATLMWRSDNPLLSGFVVAAGNWCSCVATDVGALLASATSGWLDFCPNILRRPGSGKEPQHVARGTQHAWTPKQEPVERTTPIETQSITAKMAIIIPMATPAGEGGAGAELDAPDWATGAGPVATIGGRGVAAAAGDEEENAAEDEP